MARPRIDGIVEAVHYTPDGEISWVRTYLRRGPTWSDRILIDRTTLLESLKAGKNFFVGQRKEHLGGTFETADALEVAQNDGQEVIIAGQVTSDKDCLAGVPLV